MTGVEKPVVLLLVFTLSLYQSGQILSVLYLGHCLFVTTLVLVFISGSRKLSRGTKLNTMLVARPRTQWKLLRLVLSGPAAVCLNVFWIYSGLLVTLDLSAWQLWEYRAELHSKLTHYSFRCCEFIRPATERERREEFIIFAVLSSWPNFLRHIKHQLERITSRCN